MASAEAASLKTLTVDFVLRKTRKITEHRYGSSHKGILDLNTVPIESKAETLLHHDCPVRSCIIRYVNCSYLRGECF